MSYSNRHRHQAWPAISVKPAPLPSIGWYVDRSSTTPPLLHANQGSSQHSDSGFWLYGGVVDWVAGQVVEWIFTWVPLDADPAPLNMLIPETGGFRMGVPSSFGSSGLMTVSATVNGVASDRIVLSIASQTYTDAAWGPEP